MAALSQPLPGDRLRITTDNFTHPFWEATRERRLIIARCQSCGTFRHPPGPFCPNCQRQEIDWVESPGRGTIFSFTICYRSPYRGQVPDFTYVPVVVDLEGFPGCRIVSTLVDADPDTVRIGQKVTLAWSGLPDGRAVPTFRLAQPQA